jgi:MEMO1 family protein
MSVLDRPRLRPHLAAEPADRDQMNYLVWDQLRLSPTVMKVTALQLQWLQMFDGEHSLREIQSEACRQLGGYLIPLEVFQRLVNDLDSALFLEGSRFRERANEPIRQPICVHQYETHPGALRGRLETLFTAPGGPGLPGEPTPDERLRAVLIPHIDYDRGGSSYAWAFKEVFQRTPASLFVIIGTSHYSLNRYTLTRKHFQTPLGVAQTDQTYIDRLVHHYGPGLFDDELGAHLPEHSIELEVVFLQYFYAQRRSFRIVPLVVGSFHDCIAANQLPNQQSDVGRMIQALRAVEQETAEPICYLISGDLAHIGPKFRDPRPVSEPLLSHSRDQDKAILRQTELADPASYFAVIAGESDQRRICGLPPTYTILEAFRPTSGKVLAYDQYVHPLGQESVSFASVAFDR